jgi:hypothetical protein
MTNEDTRSKAEKLIEANRKRKLAEEANQQANEPTDLQREDLNEEDEATKEQKIEAAEKRAEIKVEAMAGSLTGDIDVEAMGDVKGNGGDAKDYEEGDPDKALGVPVYEHGLAATREGVDVFSPAAERAIEGETRVSSRTQAELQRGREALENRKAPEKKTGRAPTRTVVTDAVNDPDGEQGKAKLEAKAKAAK